MNRRRGAAKRFAETGVSDPAALTRRRLLRAGLAASVAAATAPLTRCVAGTPAPSVPTSLPPAPAGPPSPRRPNLILFVTDDQRADCLSCSGNPVLQTPHIDAMAAGGVRFTQSFATTAICMSSRASILTGLHTRCHGIDSFEKPLARPLLDRSYPVLLRQAGYRTGFIGKWGLGGPLPVSDYDFFDGFAGQGFYFEPGSTEHLTNRQADSAVKFLQQSAADDRPFCLAISFKAPHVQDEGRNVPGIYPKYPYDRALQPLYLHATIPPPTTVDAAPWPAFIDQTLNRTREAPDFQGDNFPKAMKALYRLIAGVDLAVGRVTDTLRQIGKADNTVILYTADHGSFYGEHQFGGKWLMLEEAIRTPMIISDPRLPPTRRGSSVDTHMMLNIDVAPTLLELAGLAPPASMQGTSLLPLARGDSPPPPPRNEWFYEHPFGEHHEVPIAPSEGIRTPRWKYIRYYQTQPLFEQLFDLQADPREQRNLIAAPEHQDVLLHLRTRWQLWRDTLSRTNPLAPWTAPA